MASSPSETRLILLRAGEPTDDMPRGISGFENTPDQLAELDRLLANSPPLDPLTDVLPERPMQSPVCAETPDQFWKQFAAEVAATGEQMVLIGFFFPDAATPLKQCSPESKPNLLAAAVAMVEAGRLSPEPAVDSVCDRLARGELATDPGDDAGEVQITREELRKLLGLAAHL